MMVHAVLVVPLRLLPVELEPSVEDRLNRAHGEPDFAATDGEGSGRRRRRPGDERLVEGVAVERVPVDAAAIDLAADRVLVQPDRIVGQRHGRAVGHRLVVLGRLGDLQAAEGHAEQGERDEHEPLPNVSRLQDRSSSSGEIPGEVFVY